MSWRHLRWKEVLMKTSYWKSDDPTPLFLIRVRGGEVCAYRDGELVENTWI